MKSFATLAVAISLGLGVASQCDAGKYSVTLTQHDNAPGAPNLKGTIDCLLSSVCSM